MSEGPSLGELERLVERNHTEFREDILDLKTALAASAQAMAAQMERFVLREVYDTHRQALEARVKDLEDGAEANRAHARTAIYTAIAAVVGAVVSAIVQALLYHGGVH